jgi:hypothetical protein
MKYCIDYYKGFKYLKEIDEITITYNRRDTSLLAFLLLYKDKRINIYINDENDFINNDCIKLFDAIKDQYPELNFVFKLRNHKASKDTYDIIKASDKNYKIFFDEFIRSWDVLHGYLDLGVSDVYIVEELGFNIIDAAALAHERGAQVRVFPNVAQSAWSHSPAFKKFFIRPEDVSIYEPYVDVMEFFRKNGNQDSLSIYYKIYAIDKKWFGKLNEMMLSFDSDIDSRAIVSNFAERRLNCGKRCLKGKKCHICEATEKLAFTLEKNNYIITRDSEPIEDN